MSIVAFLMLQYILTYGWFNCLVLIPIWFPHGVLVSFASSCDVPHYLLYPVWFFVSRVICFPVSTSNSVRFQIATDFDNCYVVTDYKRKYKQTQQDALLEDKNYNS
jgi:hypothetical protein